MKSAPVVVRVKSVPPLLSKPVPPSAEVAPLSWPAESSRARAVLAEALSSHGAFDEAAAEAKHALALVSGSERRVVQIFVSVAAARVTAVIDQKRNPQNLSSDLHHLELVAAQAALDLWPLALEARLAKDAMAMNSNRPASIVRLKALESEARSRGLLRIASKARAVATNTPVYSAAVVSRAQNH